MNGITYTTVGEYQLPNITLQETNEATIGKYGRMRKAYLQQHRKILYNQLLLSGKLLSHLMEIEKAANDRLEILLPELAKEAGATEELKAEDPLQWVGLMNTCKAQAEETIQADLIYS